MNAAVVNPPADLSACPARADLQFLATGKLPATMVDAVANHVSSCDSCRSILAEVEQSDIPLLAACRKLVARPAELGDERAMAFERRIPLFASPLDEAATPASTAAETADQLVGKILGHYQIVSKLGRGGMGTVFRARHSHLQRLVAIKTISANKIIAEAISRFAREMVAIGRVDHPNVVRAFDAGVADGVHYIAMELLDGRDLASTVRVSVLQPNEVCNVIRQAAFGLEYIHSHGLVHRDIKPSNLFLTREGIVKILDLGLARLVQDDEGLAGLTDSRHVLGTFDYIAPEQADRATHADIRADIYSLGCTFYHLLTGKPPFVGDQIASPIQKLLAHARQPAPDVRRSNSEVSPELAKIVAKMMAKRPEQRYATPSAVVAALDSIPGAADLQELSRRSCAIQERQTPNAPILRTQQFTPTRPARFPWPTLSRRQLLGLGAGILTPGLLFAWYRDSLNHTKSQDNAWHELLAAPPQKTLWRNVDGQSRYVFDESRQELLVSSDRTSLFKLIDVEVESFKLQVSLRQTKWTGECGVFLGCKMGTYRGEPSLEFQTVELQSYRKNSTKEAFTLIRAKYHVRGYDKPYPAIDTAPLASIPIPSLPPDEQMLELTVEPRGMVSVRWQGLLCDALTSHEVNANFTPVDYVGGCGLFNGVGATTFRGARFISFKE